MATVGEGKAVLIIVDTQVGVMSRVCDRQRVTSNAADVVKKARQNGVPVVWIQHADEDLQTGSTEWQWTPELMPEQNEPVISKHHHSSFERTRLARTLAELEGKTIIASDIIDELNTVLSRLS